MIRRRSPHGPIVYGVTIPLSARAFLRGQLNLLAPLRNDVHLVYGPDGEGPVDEIDQRVTQRCLPVRRDPAPLQDLRGLHALIQYLSSIRPGTVVMGTPKMGLLGLLAAWLIGVPRRIYVLYGLRLQGATGMGRVVLWIIERISMACATEILALSPSNRDEALKLRLVSSRKIQVLGDGSIGGVDLERFSPPQDFEKGRARDVFEIPLEAPVLGFVGRLTPDKGLGDMVEMWRRVSSAVPEAWFLLVGPNESSDMGVEHLVDELRTLPRVVVAGARPDPETAYKAVDVLVLLTRREGFGMVVIEAAACGVPSVASAVNGTVDAISCGETGRLVDWGDVQGAAAAVTEYLTNDNLRRQHGARAKQRAVEKFSASRVNGLWLDHISGKG
ncbi:glycosyltransferase [Nocardioides gilvus]|uniref:glycosyltransferase n=1 Tax=Nocardioides gilvus TaxID=1735589 RepID=UPI000D748F01|nr:glycosyltransferase [Nocardioides gilvus]